MTRKTVGKSIAFLVCFLAAFLYLAAIWVEYRFGTVSLETIFFHLLNPLDHAPGAYLTEILKRAGAAVLIALAWLMCFRLPSAAENSRIYKSLLIFPPVFLVGAVLFICVKFSLPGYLYSGFTRSAFFEDYYCQVNLEEIKFPEKKRNVIILMLESIEMNLNDDDLFPEPLIPRLGELQRRGVSCHLLETFGAEWMAGSLTGLLFGLPLRPPVNVNKYVRADHAFLPGAVSLLDVFESNGYSVNFIVGSDSSFAGVKNIFLSHLKSPGLYDLNYLTAQGLPRESPWGVRDKYLYQAARNLIVGLNRSNSPFMLLIKTADTHSPAAVYADGPRIYNDARDSFVAADNLAVEFLDWLARQDFYADTTVLVVGDHVYMAPKLGPIALEQDLPSRLYNVFLNTVPFDGRPGASRAGTRVATMWDMGASLLEGIGVELPGGCFGLGMSIFHDGVTLAERFEAGELVTLIRGRSPFYDKLFQPPAEP